MFGYVIGNTRAMNATDRALYRAHYCGLCKELKALYGSTGAMNLSYDMVFLEMVLSDLGDFDEEIGWEKCFVHPFKEHEYIITECTSYAADMLILLSYYSILDNIADEGRGRRMRDRILRFIPETESKYPRQSEAVKSGIAEINENEKRGVRNPEMMSLIFGNLLGEIFLMDKESFFGDDLRALGCGLGRFIYILDAWRDRKADKRKSLYNPLSDNDRLSVKNMLLDAASCASSAFERLPLDRYVPILRNILYSGIWMKFGKGGNND